MPLMAPAPALRIGHFMPGIWEPGGVAAYIRRVSGEQARRGAEVLFFDSKPRSASSDRADAVERPVIRVEDAVDLYRRAARLRVDVLHLHEAVTPAPPSQLPAVRTLHGHRPYCPSGSRLLARQGLPCDKAYSPAGCLASRFADRCGSVRPAKLLRDFRRVHRELRSPAEHLTVTVSEFLRLQMVRHGHPAERLRVLPLPAPEGAAPAPLPRARPGVAPRVLFAGRIVPKKGLHWLLHSLQRVRRPLHLDVAGDGHALPAMRRLASDLGLDARVTFHGWVAPEAMRSLLEGCVAVAIPSLWHEPAGFVALEAMAQGRAVIASAVGGLPEAVVHHATGLLVAPGDRAQLAAALDLVAADPDRAARLGLAGRRRADHHSLEQHVTKLHAIYQEAFVVNPVLHPVEQPHA